MIQKHLKITLVTACALVAVGLVFRAWSGGDATGVKEAAATFSRTNGRSQSSDSGPRQGGRESNRNADAASPQEPRPLELPVSPLDRKSLEKPVYEAVVASHAPRAAMPDDDILTRGGVLPVMAETSKSGETAQGPRSIKSEDWKGAANLLVNALRAGDRFEVNHDELMDFLRGKDLLGWPESLRNWIGDELMTALRQDMPDKAFESLKFIESDTTAPAAMRDYSVQHISHLVTSGVIGKEGVDYIWQTLERNDPQTLSTALISLHRLSEQVSGLVSATDVQTAAGRLKKSPDERTRITAESVLQPKKIQETGK